MNDKREERRERKERREKREEKIELEHLDLRYGNPVIELMIRSRLVKKLPTYLTLRYITH